MLNPLICFTNLSKKTIFSKHIDSHQTKFKESEHIRIKLSIFEILSRVQKLRIIRLTIATGYKSSTEDVFHCNTGIKGLTSKSQE